MNLRISRSAIKLNAKAQIRSSNPHACLVGLVYVLLLWVLGILSTRVSGFSWKVILEGDPDVILEALRPSFGKSAVSLALEVVSIMLGVGFSIFALNVSRMRPASFGNLFDGFGIFLRAIWLTILMEVFIALWSCLLIVPGIIAAYKYRQAMYLLIDNPDMTAWQCICASKEMMKGHKWELFVLDLSFLGWAILSCFPFVTVWTYPYFEITYANYYNALLGLHNSQVDNGGFRPDSGSDGYTDTSKDPWDN